MLSKAAFVLFTLLASTATGEITPIGERGLTLVDSNEFSYRDFYLMEQGPIETLLIDSVCLGGICEEFLDTLLPQFKMLVTFDLEGATMEGPGLGTSDAEFAADASMVLYSTPGGLSLFNKLIEALAGPALVPSAFIAYWGADVDFTGNRDSRNLIVSAQDTAVGTSFYDVVEYEDTNGDGQYTPGEDTVVQTVELSRMAWDDMVVDEVDVDGEIKAWTFDGSCDLTSSENDNTGRFNVKFAAANAAVVDGNEALITPKSTKIDISITDFPYAGSNSFLAIRTTVGAASNSFDVIASRSGGYIQMITDDGVESFFDWTENVQYDGDTIKVTNNGFASVTGEDFSLGAKVILLRQDTQVKETYFSFQGETPNPSQVTWDPSVGFGSHPEVEEVISAAGSLSPLFVNIFLIVAAMALAL